MTARYVGEVKRWEKLSKMEKELMDMDNSAVIAGGEGAVRVLNGNGKNTIENKKAKIQ